MNLHNGTEYGSNYARAAAYFLSTCAPEPKDAGRLEAYRLITGIYGAVFDDPAALGWKPVQDLWFAPWEQQHGREKDVKSIREPIQRTETLVKELFDAVEAGEATEDGLLFKEGHPAPKRALKRALEAAGCRVESAGLMLPAGCAGALKELCAVSRANIVHITDGPQEDKAHLLFSRCVFDPAENWTAKAFDSILCAEGRLVALCGELEKRGYTRVDCRDGKKISLDYVKRHGKKDEPIKMAWGERVHSGIEVSYEELRKEPCFIWIRMPMFKTVLGCEAKLPKEAAAFIADCTKNCDGCRYCVQTDKTGARPLAAMKFGGGNKCPNFPGFTMNWRVLTEELVEKILLVLDALDALDELE